MDGQKFFDGVKSGTKENAAIREFVSSKLGLSAGQMAVVSNGKMIGPFSEGEVFTTDDFSLLERFGHSEIVPKIVKMVKKLKIDPNKFVQSHPLYRCCARFIRAV